VADDLYFEGGRVRLRFLQLCASGHVSAALLRALLAASTPAHATLWEELLGAAFAAFRGFSFTEELQVRGLG